MTEQTPLIALEIHDRSLWEPSRVLPIIETMERWGYNALVLHQNDLLDVCTQIGHAANYGVSDLRLKKVRNAVAWLNQLVSRLDKFGARFFVEIKEPSIHDYALEFYPGLIDTNGRFDPTSVVWADVCRAKTTDLLERVPGLGGLIVNLSSPESRVSLPDYLAQTERAFEVGAWFDAMIEAFHQPLANCGKALFIRDFSYTEDFQSDVLAAINRTPERHGQSVGASVKITAHDYFPEFPENPGAAMVNGDLVFEFESFGEHMGCGVIPNCRVAEFRNRMSSYRDRGAVGLLNRVSWEAITGTTALDSLSAVNVYALPKLIAADQDETSLVLEWLWDDYGIEGDAAREAAHLLLESWKIPALSYWNGEVFPRHSCLPSTWQEGWLSMETSGMGKRGLDFEIMPDDPWLTDEAGAALFDAKEAGVALADDLAARASELKNRLPTGLAKQFEAFAWLPFFARQFELATKATFYAARAKPHDFKEIGPIVDRLMALADEIGARSNSLEPQPHHHHVLLDPEQIRRFARSLPTS
ncbi:MAG: hypothetical protein AAGA88_01565 [Pseudomonadota bacterium]